MKLPKTKILNLSKIFTFKQQCINFKSFQFPSGEEHIIINDHDDVKSADKIIIASGMNNTDSNVMQLLLATDAIRGINNDCKIELFAPCFPYGRQDRRANRGEPFSIKVIANVINNQDYSKVHVLDPHSDVTTALVNNINIIDNTSYVNYVWNDIIAMEKYDAELKQLKLREWQIIQDKIDSLPSTLNNEFYEWKTRLDKLDGKSLVSDPNSNICIVSPDAGAEKKVYKIAEKLKILDDNIIHGSKKRNTATGHLSNCNISGNVKNKSCVIFDDICDGGGTFINLASKLKANGARNIYLAVSHGIFTRELGSLFNVIKTIYTTDSVKLVKHENIKTFRLGTLIENI